MEKHTSIRNSNKIQRMKAKHEFTTVTCPMLMANLPKEAESRVFMAKILQTHMLNLKILDVSSTINKFVNMQNIWSEMGMYVRRPPCEKKAFNFDPGVFSFVFLYPFFGKFHLFISLSPLFVPKDTKYPSTK